jgi:uncharacterized protein (DUF885 family)
MKRNRWVLYVAYALLVAWVGRPAAALSEGQDKQPAKPKDGAVPDLRELLALPRSELRSVTRRYEADRGSLNRSYSIPTSSTRQARMRRFYAEWLAALQKLDADKLSAAGRADLLLLKGSVRRELRQLALQARSRAEIASLVPFGPTIIGLEESRRRMEKVESARAAGLLNDLKKEIERTRQAVEAGLKSKDRAVGIPVDKARAGRAAEAVAGLRTTLKNWFDFYNGYDPLITWWMGEPYREADQGLRSYAAFLRETATSAETSDGKVGPDPEPDGIFQPPEKRADVPDLAELIAQPESELRGVIERYQADRGSLGRAGSPRVPLPVPPRSAERLARMKKFHTDWLAALDKLDFDKLGHDGRVDYLLLKNHLQSDLRRLELQAKAREEVARFLPFEPKVLDLDAARRRRETTAPAKAVSLLKEIKKEIDRTREALEAGLKKDPETKLRDTAAGSAVEAIGGLRTALTEWFDHGKTSDPKWADPVREPYREVDQALQGYAAFLHAHSSGPRARDASGIVGRPIGREALLVELAAEMIPYTPEELIAIADKEYAWCEAEMKKASREMGFGDDWHKAVEKVKTLHVAPGKQPELIRDLAREAIDYVRKHDLVTVPPLARETWRMEMMSPRRQLVNPFFTGGEVISVSFPTNTMAHEAKLQSMRGNNVPFARATVHHELIPGHHLQGFMTARYRGYRRPFGTAFWTEGWALYWEMVLYEKGFVKSPEDRVGMLFWRMHRCARITFSLGFHLGKMSPQECIDLLVKRVGHERDNATAEVRRSFAGNYGPLYQAAYMLGGLQIRALRHELVGPGKMTDRAFHDAILKENRMPIAMVRAILTKPKLTRDYVADWKFYGPDPGKDSPRGERPR